jgi:hypothetical protein
MSEHEPDQRKGEERRQGDRRKGGERRSGYDRRAGGDRRTGGDRRQSPGRRADDIEEHRKVERRINEYPMSDEELEFIRAVNEYKQRYNKPFPTWSEILHILKSMGYQKADS